MLLCVVNTCFHCGHPGTICYVMFSLSNISSGLIHMWPPCNEQRENIFCCQHFCCSSRTLRRFLPELLVKQLIGADAGFLANVMVRDKQGTFWSNIKQTIMHPADSVTNHQLKAFEFDKLQIEIPPLINLKFYFCPYRKQSTFLSGITHV